MYNTMRELVEATRIIFATQNRLNGGKYAPQDNEVGCAIGCHFGLAQQLELDSADSEIEAYKMIYGDGMIVALYAIDSLLTYSPKRRAIVHAVISPDIPMTELRAMQEAHDSPSNYRGLHESNHTAFMRWLDNWLALDDEKNGVTHPLFVVPESSIVVVPVKEDVWVK